MKILFHTFVLLFFTLNSQATFTLHQGDINGAPYTVAAPEGWKGGKVFFHVHGWRPAEAPHMADLDLNDPFYQKLLDADWVIGRTAFLENGVDPVAHTKAIDDLKAWIDTELGSVDLLILEGESTAGTLVLRIAERHPALADGVIAMGAFMNFEDPSSDDFLSAKPLVPAVLMGNTSEIVDPVQYAAMAIDLQHPPSLRPLLRPGHVNVNWLERWDTVIALEASIKTGEPIGFSDGTRKVPARATGTEVIEGQLVNTVTQVNPFYGNAFLGFHPDELTKAGVVQGESFEIEAHDQTWPVFFGSSYGDVPAGEWVAFPTADEQILLVRNHQSAIETANLKIGDTVRIQLPE